MAENPIFIDGLNPQQREAVLSSDGPMLIVAGAGSGKTKVLTTKVARLLAQGVEPYRILAITFTNKAAGEMRQRVDQLAGPAAKDVCLYTFHAFCARLLRREIDKLPAYDKKFAIYDSADSRNLVKQALKELNVDEKLYSPAAVAAVISKAKNAMQSPEDFAGLGQGFYDRKMAELYACYQKKLRENNALDFDDLLLVSLELLQQNKAVREKYQERFRYILVDEYQDTNRVQYLLTKILAAKHRNICVVGDGDQSIYGWRGADIRNILDFEKDYPEAKVIKLEQNYRSTQVILDAANAVIAHNRLRRPKELWTANKAGTKLIHYQAADEKDEARFIIERIRELQRTKKMPLGAMAVLYRTNSQSRIIEEFLVKSGINYTIVGGTKFYERKEVKDLLAYLRVIANPKDGQDLLRIINVPKRGIGGTTVDRLTAAAAQQGRSLFEVLTDVESIEGLNKGIKNKLEDLASLFFSFMAEADDISVKELIADILDKTGYIKELEESGDPQDASRVENLKELLSVAEDYLQNGGEDELTLFLEHVSLVTDIDEAEFEEDRVTLMTLHAAKGLEFPAVFITGLEKDLFPHAQALIDEEEMEEERRLCYVGITRAKSYLFLTNARLRTIYGFTRSCLPSDFLAEIPAACIYEYQRPGGDYSQTSQQVRVRPNVQATGNNWSVGTVRGFVPQVNSARQRFRPGEQVKHSKWGAGTVVAVKDDGDAQEVKVAFAGGGIRSFLTKYAVLEKL